MKCSSCGASSLDGSLFCKYCGSQYDASTNSPDVCPKCRVIVEKEMEFCGKCGADLQKTCPGCFDKIRWHHEHCPKCGISIKKKEAELAAEAERERQEEARLREEARIAEEKRKAEEARQAAEREAERKRRAEEAEARRQRRKLWWKRNGWKVAVGVVLAGAVTGYLLYRSSDLYAYKQAEKLYESGDLSRAASAFSALGDYRDSQDRSDAIRYEIAEGLYESGDLSAAASAFEGIAGYRDSHERSNALRYDIAEGLYASGDMSGAASAFSALGDYRDSRDRVRVIGWNLLGFTKEGEVITDNSTGLQWRVGPDENTIWNAANNWVNGLGGNWRMPTRAELRGLWDAGISSDNWGPFENSGWWVWSGEVRDSSSAWDFVFGSGTEYWDGRGHEHWMYRSISYNGGRAFAVRSL